VEMLRNIRPEVLIRSAKGLENLERVQSMTKGEGERERESLYGIIEGYANSLDGATFCA